MKILRHFILYMLLLGVAGTGLTWHLQRLALNQPPPRLPEPLRQALAGQVLDVPAVPGWWRIPAGQRQLLAVVGARQVKQETVDLCRQSARKGKNAPIIPIKGGHDWPAVLQAVERREARGLPPHYELRNLLLDGGPSGWDIPAFEIDGRLVSPQPKLRLRPRASRPQWVASDAAGLYHLADAASDAPFIPFEKRLWLIWRDQPADGDQPNLLGDRALEVSWIRHGACAHGALRFRLYERQPLPLPPDQPWPLYLVPEGEAKPAMPMARLASGRHPVPLHSQPVAEDRSLFEQALAQGLIREDAQGRIQVAPPDLHRLWGAETQYRLSDWPRGQDDGQLRKVNRQLHYNLNGRYIKRQIAAYNDERLLSALRWRPANRAARSLSVQIAVRVQKAPGRLRQDGMPLRAAGLFRQPPLNWANWQRVTHWPALADAETDVAFELHLSSPARGNERLDLLLIGASQPRVQGARIIRREARCLARRCTPGQAQGWYLLLDLDKGVSQIALRSQPLSGRRRDALYADDPRPIQRQDKGLQWRAAPPRLPPPRAKVTLVSRNGETLWKDDQAAPVVAEAGLGGLVGFDPAQESALPGVLARLGRLGQSQAQARLSIDLRLQQQAHEALRQSLAQGVAGWRSKDPYARERQAVFVIMDADQGDILALAGLPAIEGPTNWADLAGFDAVRGAVSPLWVRGLQHRGDNLSLPGSTFKLVTALLLERQATQDAVLDELLEGVSLERLNQLGQRWPRLVFHASAGCYPAFTGSMNCLWGGRNRQRGKRQPVINNFGINGVYETPAREMQLRGDSRYGLAQALRDSLNTWFAWLFEQQDGTLLGRDDIPGLPDSRALAPGALDQLRPFDKLLSDLGLGQPRYLDGGLLPNNFPWRHRDLLRATAAAFEPTLDRHNLRQMAIGLRAHVTPLDMTLISATIATGKIVQPRLLLELNQSPALLVTRDLGIRTDRIRAGMKRVALDGTARLAFLGKAFDKLRPGLYLKTGTAPVQTAKGKVNNAWLTGWLAADLLPDEPRRLAFTCKVTHARHTGGKVCGAIVATFLRKLMKPEKEQVLFREEPL